MNCCRRRTAHKSRMYPFRIHECKCTPIFRQNELIVIQKYQQIVHLCHIRHKCAIHTKVTANAADRHPVTRHRITQGQDNRTNRRSRRHITEKGEWLALLFVVGRRRAMTAMAFRSHQRLQPKQATCGMAGPYPLRPERRLQ